MGDELRVELDLVREQGRARAADERRARAAAVLRVPLDVAQQRARTARGSGRVRRGELLDRARALQNGAARDAAAHPEPLEHAEHLIGARPRTRVRAKARDTDTDRVVGWLTTWILCRGRGG